MGKCSRVLITILFMRNFPGLGSKYFAEVYSKYVLVHNYVPYS